MRLNTDLLKSFRSSKNLSLDGAGRLIKVSYQTWWQWENGIEFPNQPNRKKLARLLGIPEIRLFVEDGTPTRKGKR